jgi:hypothetical protein
MPAKYAQAKAILTAMLWVKFEENGTRKFIITVET